MKTPNQCPKCSSENIYFDGNVWTCPECFHEFTASPDTGKPSETDSILEAVRDAHGQPLSTGDSVTVIKELKIKGSSSVVKVGTKVKNIRIVDGHDGHNIACKIDGLGAINLKSEFVKKA